MPLSANQFVRVLQETLRRRGIDYQTLIDEFGQVEACEQRAAGRQFSIDKHVRGLVLALLSSQRPWGPIARNLQSIEDLFFGFRANRVAQANADHFLRGLTELRCGNRSVSAQMHSLADNIRVFRRIESEFGTLDAFVTSAEPDSVAGLLSSPNSKYKLRQIGFPLAMEYLRNVGIQASKPDVHVRRVISGERLGFSAAYPSERQAYYIIDRLAHEASLNATYLDNLLWLFCAQDYGAVCGAQPMCHLCGFRQVCNIRASKAKNRFGPFEIDLRSYK